MDNPRNPEIIRNRFSVSPTMNPKSYECQMKHNNYTEVSGYSFQHISNENAPPPDSLNAQILFCPEFR